MAFFLVLGIKSKAWYMLISTHSITEVYPQPLYEFLIVRNIADTLSYL